MKLFMFHDMQFQDPKETTKDYAVKEEEEAKHPNKKKKKRNNTLK